MQSSCSSRTALNRISRATRLDAPAPRVIVRERLCGWKIADERSGSRCSACGVWCTEHDESHCGVGHLAVVDVLLAMGCDRGVRDLYGADVVQCAGYFGRKDVVRRLLGLREIGISLRSPLCHDPPYPPYPAPSLTRLHHLHSCHSSSSSTASISTTSHYSLPSLAHCSLPNLPTRSGQRQQIIALTNQLGIQKARRSDLEQENMRPRGQNEIYHDNDVWQKVQIALLPAVTHEEQDEGEDVANYIEVFTATVANNSNAVGDFVSSYNRAIETNKVFDRAWSAKFQQLIDALGNDSDTKSATSPKKTVIIETVGNMLADVVPDTRRILPLRARWCYWTPRTSRIHPEWPARWHLPL